MIAFPATIGDLGQEAPAAGNPDIDFVCNSLQGTRILGLHFGAQSELQKGGDAKAGHAHTQAAPDSALLQNFCAEASQRPL